MLTFSVFDSAAITTEKNAVSRCHEFGSPVPFGLLQFNDITTLSSTGSQQVSMGSITVSAVNRCCANVERAERELSSFSRDLALAALCLLRAAFLSARFPRRFFRASALHISLSSRCFLPRFFLPRTFQRTRKVQTTEILLTQCVGRCRCTVEATVKESYV